MVRAREIGILTIWTATPSASRFERSWSVLKHLSLFTGIGGFDLGLERAGIETVGQVENDLYAKSVLQYRWPEVVKEHDVREVSRASFGAVDLISGGFPCQDISVANTQRQG